MMIEAGKTYRLRFGLTARITVTDIKGSKRSIGGYINLGDREMYQSWYPDGRAYADMASDCDIVMPDPERKSVWMNWYGLNGGGKDHETRERADRDASNFRTHVFEIIIEDGDPVDVKIHKVEK